MGDAIEAAASRPAVCYLVSGDNEGEPIQSGTNVGGTNVGQANTCQAGGWGLAPVPYDGTYGVRAFPAAAALKDGSDSVCELENNLLPLVCAADDEAAAAEAAKARAETLDCPSNPDMPPCPSEWHDPVPVGWKSYGYSTKVFHCGFKVMVANCVPQSGRLQQECAYDEAGQLVKNINDVQPGEPVHIDYRCAGTPNSADAEEHPFKHFFGEGGPIQAGWGGFIATFWHADRKLPKFPPR